VEPGAVADLLVLDGNPLSEPDVLLDAGRMRLVYQEGVSVGAASRRI
jgi:imidazolonepropionase-like amidohydrolase